MAEVSLGSPLKLNSELVAPLLPKEVFRVGRGLDLIVLPIEHNKATLAMFGQEIKKQISNVITDGVIPEFSESEIQLIKRDEMQNWMATHFAGDYQQILSFYGFIEQETRSANKTMYVLDPAHDANYVFPTLTDQTKDFILQMPGLAAGIYGLTSLITKLNKIFHGQRSKLTRRDFFKVPIVIGLGSLALANANANLSDMSPDQGQKESGFPNEIELRRATVAKLINVINDENEKNNAHQNLLLIYPPRHWQGIKELMEDDQKRENILKARFIFKVNPTVYDSLFKGRIYNWINGKANLISRIGFD